MLAARVEHLVWELSQDPRVPEQLRAAAPALVEALQASPMVAGLNFAGLVSQLPDEQLLALFDAVAERWIAQKKPV